MLPPYSVHITDLLEHGDPAPEIHAGNNYLPAGVARVEELTYQNYIIDRLIGCLVSFPVPKVRVSD